MSGQLVPEALNVSPPGSGGTASVPSGASSTAGAAVDLASYAGRWLWIKSSVKTHVRFASTPTAAAATTGDIYLTPDVDYAIRVPRSVARQRYFRVYGNGGSGTLYYRVTSGPM